MISRGTWPKVTLKMLSYIHNEPGLRTINSDYHVISLAGHLFAAEEFAIIAIKSPFFSNVLKLFQYFTKHVVRISQ